MANKEIVTKWETVDGRRVRIRAVYPKNAAWPDAATHPPLLLIHGLGCSVEAWKPALRCLAEAGLDRPVYAADMPGYGRSPGPRAALGITEMADWTARLMDVLGIPRVHLAGNSMGCQVALAFARQHPERVGALVLASPTDGGDMVPLWRSTLGLLLDAFLEPMLYNGTLIKMYLQMGVPRYLATVVKMIQDDPIFRAEAVKAPCLIVRGGIDPIVPERAARQLAASLPNGSFIELEKAAHALQFNAPEEFTRIALAFWKRIEASEAAGVALWDTADPTFFALPRRMPEPETASQGAQHG